MIKTIGFNKAVLIFLLALFCVLAFGYTHQILQPGLIKKQRMLSGNKSEISRMRSDLDKLTAGMDKFEQQKADFETVQKLGFFDPQNRVMAKQRIVAIQRESRLLSAKYTIKPAESITGEKLSEVGYKILKTDIDFTLEALEDADIYKFIYILNYGFPGQVLIKNISMSRDKEITQPLLRKIGVGQPEAIVKATVSISWQTIVPDETIAVTGRGGAR